MMKKNDQTSKTKKEILETHVSAHNKIFLVDLSYADEGYYGDYDEEDPEDEPLLRIDIYTKDEDNRRRWSDEAYYSTCTGISARVSEKEAKSMCRKVIDNLNVLPQNVTDYFSGVPTDDVEDWDDYLMRAWETALVA